MQTETGKFLQEHKLPRFPTAFSLESLHGDRAIVITVSNVHAEVEKHHEDSRGGHRKGGIIDFEIES